MFPTGNFWTAITRATAPSLRRVSECKTTGAIHADRHDTTFHISGLLR
jgi:hypothetical protein